MDSASRSFLAVQNDERKSGVWGERFKRQLSVKRPINTQSSPLVIPASLGATRNPFVDKRQNCGFLNEFPARSAQWILHHARTSLSRMTSVESGVWGAL
ncbi:hypothetical protein QNF06_002929 [Vibrio vulnificus]|nr:hypothetical protein [Vibrio vulnificus]HAS8554509.1 hypothetical protein [Vibrio vulnificus]